jgi:hypothetical protein
MRWHLILEEFGPELLYIKGKNNIVADALSRLDIDDDLEIFNITECFGFDEDNLPPSSFPVCYRDIAKKQQADPAIQHKLAIHKDYSKATFCGGDKVHNLICHNGEIALPPSLQQRTVNWYHKTLCHPGET